MCNWKEVACRVFFCQVRGRSAELVNVMIMMMITILSWPALYVCKHMHTSTHKIAMCLVAIQYCFVFVVVVVQLSMATILTR